MVTGHGRGTTEQGVLLSLHLGRQAKMANSCGSGRPFKNLGTELALQVPQRPTKFWHRARLPDTGRPPAKLDEPRVLGLSQFIGSDEAMRTGPLECASQWALKLRAQ